MTMTTTSFAFELLDDPKELASYQGWSEQVYRDMLAVRSGKLSESDFYARYQWQKAIMVLDMTGFTRSTIELGELPALLRIVEMQQVCLPVIRDGGADLIRTFADDLVALFDHPSMAVQAAFELHARMEDFACNNDGLGVRCSIGIGYGKVLKIGPNLAQGDEMNRASKLGEDIAGADETLVTGNVADVLAGRSEFSFSKPEAPDGLFPYFRAHPGY